MELLYSKGVAVNDGIAEDFFMAAQLCHVSPEEATLGTRINYVTNLMVIDYKCTLTITLTMRTYPRQASWSICGNL